MKPNNKWNELTMQQKADLMKLYVANGYTNLNKIKEHYLGTPYKSTNDSDYDYYNAHIDNLPKEEGEHYSSRNPITAQLLKGSDHPTRDLMLQGENNSGYTVYKNTRTGKEYSVKSDLGDLYGYEKVNKYNEGGPAETQTEEKSGWQKAKDLIYNVFNIKEKQEIQKRPPKWENNYSDLTTEYKQKVDTLANKLNINEKDIESYYNSGMLNPALSVYYRGVNARKRDNDSKTSNTSTSMETLTNLSLYKGKNSTPPNMAYAIPYIEDLEIKVPGVGRTTKNALDSLAKYATLADIPLSEALGLAAQETALGAIPLYNYVSVSKGKTEKEKQERKDFNRALGNSSYFRNYGVIPAENLVRDFRYNIIEDPIDRNIPPLLHAFEYWKEGNYNRGDPNHTNDVRRKGIEVINTNAIKQWIENSEFAKKALKNETNNYDDGGPIDFESPFKDYSTENDIPIKKYTPEKRVKSYTPKDEGIGRRLLRTIIRNGDLSMHEPFEVIKNNKNYILYNEGEGYGNYDGIIVDPDVESLSLDTLNSFVRKGSPTDIYLNNTYDSTLYKTVNDLEHLKYIDKTLQKHKKKGRKLNYYKVKGDADTIRVSSDEFNFYNRHIPWRFADGWFSDKKGNPIYDAGDYTEIIENPNDSTVVITPIDVFDFMGIGNSSSFSGRDLSKMQNQEYRTNSLRTTETQSVRSAKYTNPKSPIKRAIGNAFGNMADNTFHPFVMQGIPTVYIRDEKILNEY